MHQSLASVFAYTRHMKYKTHFALNRPLDLSAFMMATELEEVRCIAPFPAGKRSLMFTACRVPPSRKYSNTSDRYKNGATNKNNFEKADEITAAENLVGYSTADPNLFKRRQLEPIKDLRVLIKDYAPIAKNALTMLVNLSEDDEVLKSLVDDNEFLESLLRRITVCQ